MPNLHKTHAMNLRQLEHLTTLAAEGSFAQAAEKIHLSQSALTRSIQALEKELGMALCKRLPRGVTLTLAGKMVVDRAKRVLLESRALNRDVMLFKSDKKEEAAFGFSYYPATLWLADVLSSLTTAYPQLSLRIEVQSATALLQHLYAETIDFLITERRIIAPSSDLVTRSIPPHRCGWFVCPRHSFLNEGKITVSKLRMAHLATLPLSSKSHERMRKTLRCAPGETLQFHVECNDLFALKQLASQSNIVIYAPVACVIHELDGGGLVELPVEYPSHKEFNMNFVIVRLGHRIASPATEKAILTIFESDRVLRHKMSHH